MHFFYLCAQYASPDDHIDWFDVRNMAGQRKSHGKYRLDQVKNNKLLGLDRTSSDIAVSSLSKQTKGQEACHTCTHLQHGITNMKVIIFWFVWIWNWPEMSLLLHIVQLYFISSMTFSLFAHKEKTVGCQSCRDLRFETDWSSYLWYLTVVLKTMNLYVAGQSSSFLKSD